jgi:hypothetical protein
MIGDLDLSFSEIPGRNSHLCRVVKPSIQGICPSIAQYDPGLKVCCPGSHWPSGLEVRWLGADSEVRGSLHRYTFCVPGNLGIRVWQNLDIDCGCFTADELMPNTTSGLLSGVTWLGSVQLFPVLAAAESAPQSSDQQANITVERKTNDQKTHVF